MSASVFAAEAGPGDVPRSSGAPWARFGLRAALITYLGFLIVLPVVTIARRGFALGAGELARAISRPVARAAFALTIETALVMSLVNAIMGTLIAYVLVRYRFRGRTLLGVVIDLPFAIPTLVAGLMIVALLGPDSAIGGAFAAFGARIVYAKPAIVIALLFVTLPFVVRAVEPVLMELDVAEEEAAETLGASEWTTFRRVVLPAISPALVSGTLLGFARALGEFGSIVVVAGNIPRRTLTSSVFVFGEIEAGDPQAACAMSLLLIAVSFVTIVLVDAYQKRTRARREHA